MREGGGRGEDRSEGECEGGRREEKRGMRGEEKRSEGECEGREEECRGMLGEGRGVRRSEWASEGRGEYERDVRGWGSEGGRETVCE